jgi:hypothetical protein
VPTQTQPKFRKKITFANHGLNKFNVKTVTEIIKNKVSGFDPIFFFKGNHNGAKLLSRKLNTSKTKLHQMDFSKKPSERIEKEKLYTFNELFRPKNSGSPLEVRKLETVRNISVEGKGKMPRKFSGFMSLTNNNFLVSNDKNYLGGDGTENSNFNLDRDSRFPGGEHLILRKDSEKELEGGIVGNAERESVSNFWMSPAVDKSKEFSRVGAHMLTSQEPAGDSFNAEDSRVIFGLANRDLSQRLSETARHVSVEKKVDPWGTNQKGIFYDRKKNFLFSNVKKFNKQMKRKPNFCQEPSPGPGNYLRRDFGYNGRDLTWSKSVERARPKSFLLAA